jgi:hypothetical protein
MSHYKLDTKPVGRTHFDWLGVGASVGKLVNQWSLRNDLVVGLVEETTIGAPACFNPASAEIEVCISKAFGTGTTAKEVGELTQRKNQLKHAVATGAIFHEALHARVSRWSLEQASKDLTPRELRFMHSLEESRIEYWGCKFVPQNRTLLRACAIEIVIGDLESHIENVSKVDAAASLALLTLARVDAGVLDQRDIVDSVQKILTEVLSEEVITKLRAIWKDFQNHQDHANALPLYDLTREFLKVLDERKEETGEEEGQEPEGGCEKPGGEGGEPGTGTGKGQPTPEQIQDFKDFIEKVKDAVQDIKEQVQIANQTDLDDELDSEERKEEVEAREQKANQQKENKKESDKVFENTGTDSHITTGISRSRLVESRSPSGDEVASANRIANALRKAKYRERSQTRIGSVVPPGRLRSRAVVQGQAQKARGIHTPVEAWRTTKRKTTEDPTLNVGIMVDISGSMRPAMTPMAITAWVMSEAVHRVQGKSAMVYYGQDVFAPLKPGQRLAKVNTFTAPDSTEEFERAFKALDGGLGLTHADGAKLLVIVSDGHYRPDMRPKAKRLLAQADKAGVAILWLTFDGKVGEPTELLRGTAGKVVSLASNESPTRASQIIGETAAKVLSAIGSRV